jgi:hypothetical protein
MKLRGPHTALSLVLGRGRKNTISHSCTYSTLRFLKSTKGEVAYWSRLVERIKLLITHSTLLDQPLDLLSLLSLIFRWS